jgi:NDP-sugar pyrophosphorylase family protein
MGSRYGGLKQIAVVGPNGQTLIDYAMFDAVKAGFGKIVFAIRESFEDAFKEKVGKKLEGMIETAYVYQKLNTCLGNYAMPENREKPWGTGHAILVAKDAINEPFAVINADDYYGVNAFKNMYDYLSDTSKIGADKYVMVGYVLSNTMSQHGGVARGICQIDRQGLLIKVVEQTNIHTSSNGSGFAHTDQTGKEHPVQGNEIVSMNMWGFHPSIFEHLQTHFNDFLIEHGSEEESEMFIPSVVDDLIHDRKITLKVLTTNDHWMGVTYGPDVLIVRKFIKDLIANGTYPDHLKYENISSTG